MTPQHRVTPQRLETVVFGSNQVAEAAQVLSAGGLVAFPTETVYGLGADAANEVAIAQVYASKGRPVGHPLIVHLADKDQLADWTTSQDTRVQQLAGRFWPGPLTLIVPRSELAGDAVTGGLQTVGLRVPDHDVARSMLAAFGGGVVGPSANRFGHVSPTTAQHVLADLSGRIDAVLDGGPCVVGIESTIVEVAGDGPVTLLRPGATSVADIEDCLGELVVDGRSGTARAAGMLASHYAPDSDVRLLSAELARPLMGDTATAVIWSELGAAGVMAGRHEIVLPADDAGFARGLYAALREADSWDVEEIVVVAPTDGPMVDAILDRLAKAAA